MKIILLLFVVYSTKAWRSNGDGFPNPIYNKKECNRHIGTPSFVCDPNNILTLTNSDRIENIIQKVNKIYGGYKYEIFVTIFNKLDIIGVDNNPMKTFTTAIYHDWMVGRKNYNSGVIFAISATNKEFYFAIGSDLLGAISYDPNKMEDVHDLVENELFTDATIRAIKNVESLLTPIINTQNTYIVILIDTGIALGILILLLIIYTIFKIASSRHLRKDVINFAKNRDLIRDCYRKNQINKVCIVCFNNENTIIYFVLPQCCHHYHTQCIDEYDILICPICTEISRVHNVSVISEIYVRYMFLRDMYPRYMTKLDINKYSNYRYLNSNMQFPQNCSIISKIMPF